MSASLTTARMSYAAALVASVTFGLYVAIAFYTAYKILSGPWRHHSAGKHVLLLWISATFIVQCIYYVAGSKWSELEFVESTQDPGVFAGQLSSRLSVLKNTAYTVAIWLADGFILYRAFAIFAGNLAFVILPALLYLGSIASGIGLLVESAKPGAAFGQVQVIDFGTPFWSISVSMNVLTTLLIAARLVYRRRALIESAHHNKPRAYAGAEAAIFLESAALYAVCSLIYIPMFAKDISLQFPFSALLVSAASISPHLIILRMVNGQSSRLETSLIPLHRRGDTEAGVSAVSREGGAATKSLDGSHGSVI